MTIIHVGSWNFPSHALTWHFTTYHISHIHPPHKRSDVYHFHVNGNFPHFLLLLSFCHLTMMFTIDDPSFLSLYFLLSSFLARHVDSTPRRRGKRITLRFALNEWIFLTELT